MSMPIVICHVFKAAKGDEKAKATLQNRLDYNKGKGGFSVWNCECDPPCPKPSEDELVALFKAMPDLTVIL
jgi:hypothetical protein